MTRRPNGLWQQTLTVTIKNQKKTIYFYGRTKKEVLEKIAAYKAEREAGLCFDVVADEWWEPASNLLAPNSLKNYTPAYCRAREHWKGVRIRQIKPTDISGFIRDFTVERNAADKTARTQLMVINLICRYAVESGYIDMNPARDVSVPKGLAKKKRCMASDEDIQRVKASTGCTFGMFAYWAMYMGCRRNELLALTWDDVDFDANMIRINKSLCWDGSKPMIKEPKTSAGIRVLPLMSALRSKIQPGRKGLVFPDESGGYMTEGRYQARYEKYQQESGVKSTAHQLRHSYASMLYEAGIEPKDMQELLGHAQLSTTMDIYTDLRAQHKQQVREKLLHVDFAD